MVIDVVVSIESDHQAAKMKPTCVAVVSLCCSLVSIASC